MIDLNRIRLLAKNILKWSKANLLLSLVVALLSILSLNFMMRSLIFAFFPYEIGQGEGFNIEVASWLLEGRSFYRILDDYPYISKPYTPLFFGMCLPFIALFGKKMVIGRLISIFFTALTGIYIYKIVNKENRAKLSSLIAAGFFLSSYLIFDWALLCRVDMVAIFYSVAGLYAISLHKKNPKAIYIAGLSFFVSLFTKQSMIAAPAAAGIYLLIEDRKKSVKFVLFLITIGLIAVAVLQLQSKGVFISTFLLRTFAGYSQKRYYHFAMQYLRIYFIPLLLILYFYLFSKKDVLYKIFFLICIFMTPSLGYPGSVSNHLIPSLTGMCILIGLAIEEFSKKRKVIAYNFMSILLIFSLIGPGGCFKFFKAYGPQSNPWSNLEVYNKITEILRESKGDVLTEYGSFAIMSGKELLLYPLQAHPLYRHRSTNIEKLINDCKDARFSCIAHKYFMKSVLGNGFKENYYLSESLKETCTRWPFGNPTWYIYRRKSHIDSSKEKNLFYLSDLEPISARQDTGILRLDRTYRKRRIALNGKVYEKGLGTHANSEIIYSVEGFDEFKAVVGVDDELDSWGSSKASIIFKVYLDDRLVLETDIFYQDTPPQEINILLSGASEIKLVVTDAGKGGKGGLISCDYADWANARFIKENR